MGESKTAAKNSITDLVDTDIISAISTLATSDDKIQFITSANKIATVFGAQEPLFSSGTPKNHGKLTTSFHNNLKLLIQKTWVEKSDAELKDQVLFQLEQFCRNLSTRPWKESYVSFLEILDNVIYLMFGAQTKKDDFTEYAIRIDPEFGIFWLYVQSLPKDTEWSDEKCRVAVFLGMYFLANY